VVLLGGELFLPLFFGFAELVHGELEGSGSVSVAEKTFTTKDTKVHEEKPRRSTTEKHRGTQRKTRGPSTSLGMTNQESGRPERRPLC
jgi:hypothetical protein